MKLDLKSDIEEMVKHFSMGRTPEEIYIFRQGCEAFLQPFEEVLQRIATFHANNDFFLIKRIDEVAIEAFKAIAKARALKIEMETLKQRLNRYEK